jgi:hypothetical protein
MRSHLLNHKPGYDTPEALLMQPEVRAPCLNIAVCAVFCIVLIERGAWQRYKRLSVCPDSTQTEIGNLSVT